MAFSVVIFGKTIIGPKPKDWLKENVPQSGPLANKDVLAQQYLKFGSGLSVDPLSFTGSKADLLDVISRETDECANYVRTANKTLSFNTARLACSDVINAQYANKLNELSKEVYENDQKAINQFFNNNKAILIIAGIVIVLLIIIYRS